MVRLTPDVESLREFNPCHDTKTGKFSASTEGRCGDTVIGRNLMADRIRDVRATDRGTAKNPLTGRALSAASYEQASARARIELRRALRRGDVPGLPRFLYPDARKAFKTDRIITTVDSKQDYARPSYRMVGISKNPRRSETLSFYRHEAGHINPRKLNTARVVGFSRDELSQIAALRADDVGREMAALRGGAQNVGATLADVFVEEVRAWRNAIASNKGRVSMPLVRSALGSYARRMFGADADRVLGRTMKVLSRYTARVRRNAKAAR